jgi:hypothetical protein
MKCPRPVPYETLVALVSGDAVFGEPAVLRHLFACDPCAEDWTRLATLVDAVRETAAPAVAAAALALPKNKSSSCE